MIKHISMGRFKIEADGRSKKANMERAKELSLKLQQLPEMISIEIGFNFLEVPNALDFVSTSTYRDMDAVKAVVSHPLHDELINFLKNVTEGTYAVTYELKE